jgi:murein L,D-transpeptidase YcbB/YkuD
LFARSQRHLSHGCIRVAAAPGFAQLIATDAGVADEWQRASGGNDHAFVDLPRELPVRLLYEPVFTGSDGEAVLRADPYDWNGPVAKALGFGERSHLRVKAEAVDIAP